MPLGFFFMNNFKIVVILLILFQLVVERGVPGKRIPLLKTLQKYFGYLLPYKIIVSRN